MARATDDFVRAYRVKPQPRPRACHAAKRAVTFYSSRIKYWLNRKGTTSVRTPRGRHCPRYLAHVLRSKAYATRAYVERWLERRARLLENPTAAILFVFGPVYGPEALRVASCESGRGIWASNGQYLGMFQMGYFARSKYGHSSTALGQARAAFAYFVDSGRDWSPWSCKP